MKSCWKCKGPTHAVKAEETRDYGVTVTATVESWCCSKCKTRVIGAAEMQRAENVWVLQAAESRVHHHHTFLWIRKALGYTGLYHRAEIEELFGVPFETVKRWESGEEPLPVKAMDTLRNEILQHDLSSLTKLQEEKRKRHDSGT